MDNVLNRPLFRRREARERLNDMAGVQGYQVGGAVIPEIPRPFTGGIAAGPTGAITRQFQQPSIRPAGLPALSSTLQENMAMDRQSLFGNALLAAAEEKVRMTQNRFENNPNNETLQRYKDAVADFEAMQGESAAFKESYAPGPISVVRDRDVLDLEGPEGSMPPDQLDIFNRLTRAAEKPLPDVVAEKPASTAPVVPKAPGVGGARPEGPAAGMPAAPAAAPAAQGPSGMEAEARGRGPLITNPAQVAVGLNDEDPTVREKTMSDFMQEFTANAPEYKGADRNLMHAMIGFAIAAGESPNAMTNIANGLLAGSEMMLKDKAAKDEFDRQVQLSAMQYGLQEVSKQRDRANEALNFVALEDTVYKGRRVKAGEQVYIPYGEIEKNGGLVPPGFGDSALAAAMAEREKGVFEALDKAYQDKLLDDTQVTTLRNDYSAATRNAMAAQRGIDYMEAAILKVGEDGSITGLKGSANDFVSKVAAAAGVDDLAAEYGDRGQVVDMVKIAFQNLIPSALSGVQTANSISNRDIELLANAYVDSMLEGGVFSMSAITEDKLLRSMKGALDLLQTGREQSLTDLRAIENQIGGRYLRSGDLTAPVPASTVIEPYRALIPGREDIGVPSQFGSLYLSEDGVYDIMRPGG